MKIENTKINQRKVKTNNLLKAQQYMKNLFSVLQAKKIYNADLCRPRKKINKPGRRRCQKYEKQETVENSQKQKKIVGLAYITVYHYLFLIVQQTETYVFYNVLKQFALVRVHPLYY